MANKASKQHNITISPEARPRGENPLLAAQVIVAQYCKEHGKDLCLFVWPDACDNRNIEEQGWKRSLNFIAPNMTPPEAECLQNAAAQAASKLPLSAGSHWLTNSLATMMSLHVQFLVVREATEQCHVLFDRPGLKVLGLPFSAAICYRFAQIANLAESDRHPSIKDTIMFLDDWKSYHARGPVKVVELQEWKDRYGMSWDDATAEAILRAYFIRFGRACFVE